MDSQVYKASQDGYITVLDGISRKTLVHGGNTLMTAFSLEQGKTLPVHSHPQEQTGFLVSGHIVLTIGETAHDIQPGDAWMIPCDTLHGARIIEDSLAIEVFSPVRQDYLK